MKYNPEQFQLIRFRKGNDGKDLTVNGKPKFCRIIVRKLSKAVSEKSEKGVNK